MSLKFGALTDRTIWSAPCPCHRGKRQRAGLGVHLRPRLPGTQHLRSPRQSPTFLGASMPARRSWRNFSIRSYPLLRILYAPSCSRFNRTSAPVFNPKFRVLAESMSSLPRSLVSWPALSGPSPGARRRRWSDRRKPVITSQGGASEPLDTLPPGRAGGAVAVRRTLASTIAGLPIRRKFLDRGSPATHQRSCGSDPRIRV